MKPAAKPDIITLHVPFRVIKRGGRKEVQLMGLMPIYQKPNTSKAAKGHKTYPYLLKGLRVTRPNQVWAADITYLPMRRGFLYLVAIMDWHTRKVLAWRISNALEADFCVEALNEAMEQFEQLLADEALRQDFYARLKAFSRCLHNSLSSDKLYDVFDEAKIDALKRDWKQFSELKRSVQLRYQETVDVREFEPKIQKLLNDHVVAMPAETIIEVVNINDPDALQAIVEETGVSEASRADRIASATRRVISERMEEDPTFYKRFSELLEETIRDYREKRLSKRDYLNSVVDLASKVARKERNNNVPESIRGNEDAQAFFGILEGQLQTKGGEQVPESEVASITLAIIEIIKSHLIVGIWSNDVAQNNLRNAIDDYFFDVLRDEKGIELPVETLDEIELKIMHLARARFGA